MSGLSIISKDMLDMLWVRPVSDHPLHFSARNSALTLVLEFGDFSFNISLVLVGFIYLLLPVVVREWGILL